MAWINKATIWNKVLGFGFFFLPHKDLIVLYFKITAMFIVNISRCCNNNQGHCCRLNNRQQKKKNCTSSQKQFHAAIDLSSASKKQFSDTALASLSPDTLSAHFRPGWKTGLPPEESIVNGINLTPGHSLLSTGTVFGRRVSHSSSCKENLKKGQKGTRGFSWREDWSVRRAGTSPWTENQNSKNPTVLWCSQSYAGAKSWVTTPVYFFGFIALIHLQEPVFGEIRIRFEKESD